MKTKHVLPKLGVLLYCCTKRPFCQARMRQRARLFDSKRLPFVRQERAVCSAARGLPSPFCQARMRQGPFVQQQGGCRNSFTVLLLYNKRQTNQKLFFCFCPAARGHALHSFTAFLLYCCFTIHFCRHLLGALGWPSLLLYCPLYCCSVAFLLYCISLCNHLACSL